MRQLTARDMDQIIKSCKRVFSRMDELMSRPLLDYRWRYLKKGSYYTGRTEKGKFVKLPKRRYLEMALLPNGKEVDISTSREKSEEITRETDGKPIPGEKRVRRYKLFGSVRSMRHIREGHLVELDALKLYLKIVIKQHYGIDKYRGELSDDEIEEYLPYQQKP